MYAGTGELQRVTGHATIAHVRDLRWRSDPDAAWKSLARAFGCVREDGSLPSRLDVIDEASTTTIADWGGALLALDAVHVLDERTREAYASLTRHAEWLVQNRLREPHLCATRPGEVAYDDRARWDDREEICGVDATVAAYGIFVWLARTAARLGDANAAARWKRVAQEVADAVRQFMWDPEAHLFRDVDAASGERIGRPCAVGFYPYRTDLAHAQHLPGLERTLLDSRAFWTPFPVATLAANDPRFSRFGAGAGGRGTARFSGPVVPYVNTHLIDGLSRAARAYAPHLRPHIAHLITRTIRMFFAGADPVRIGSHEFYDPIDGVPSLYRPAADSTQSWMIDVIVQYVAGIRPHSHGVTIDPMPFGLEMVELNGARIRGHRLDVRIDGERVTATVDGTSRESRIGTPMEIAM
jgi:hypothetical protein